ncbi:RNA polymerase sigma factor [Paenibacillus eucommiae]|uniref:RNA polymerase sigma-70 factor (ECF subfamily) n=1 Tax=Paenibacillus eucommiae TaxID=1355755 RepID=A0ABS4IMU2_9BACL|nr:sigma-70 family RNA polymerase sigma factor [Paenibacillus eucommiae]MBP1988884.1 RNA polymerase sigma-70 factor (ECF subfamily) [Paenibacillus eucommiae]
MISPSKEAILHNDAENRKEYCKREGGEKIALNNNQSRAIKALYMEMYYLLLAYAQSPLSDRLLAEEAVQETFRIACAKADKLLSSPNPNGWLLITLKNVITNKVRSRAYHNSKVFSSLYFDENFIPGDTHVPNVDFMYSDLANSEDYKLLKMIVLDRYSMLEAAQEVGISVEACKKRVQRAKKKLKERLKV